MAKESKGSEASASSSPPATLALTLPLSDKVLDLKFACALLSSAQTREKVLKIFQYAAKLLAYFLLRGKAEAASLGKHLDALAKSLSTARRCFKLLRWIKHFDDLAEARAEKSAPVQKLLLLDVACNVAADISEDLTSLEKVGFLRKGTLPKRTEYYSNWCQMLLAVVEIFVSHVKQSRARAKCASDGSLANQRKSTLAGLELSKYYADLVKAFWDCELSFASELAFCISGLWAALVSAHKYALKAK